MTTGRINQVAFTLTGLTEATTFCSISVNTNLMLKGVQCQVACRNTGPPAEQATDKILRNIY